MADSRDESVLRELRLLCTARGFSPPDWVEKFFLKWSGRSLTLEGQPDAWELGDNQGIVQSFLHLTPRGSASGSELAEVWLRLGGELPAGVIPFAMDPGGNIYALNAANGRVGVLFIDGHRDIRWVADSWTVLEEALSTTEDLAW